MSRSHWPSQRRKPASFPPLACPISSAAARAEDFDAAALAAEAAGAGNVVIPLVRKLTDAVAARNPESARYVHRGATSQDIIDTAVVLRLRAASTRLVADLTQVNAYVRGVGARACRHADARPHLATACEPNDLRLEGCWMARHARALLGNGITDSVDRALVVQLGGAAGTLASLGKDGPAVTDALARQLGLRVPAMPWHSQRDRIVEVAAAFGIACGALGKIGRDLTLLAQSEVAEAFEKPSSSRRIVVDAAQAEPGSRRHRRHRGDPRTGTGRDHDRGDAAGARARRRRMAGGVGDVGGLDSGHPGIRRRDCRIRLAICSSILLPCANTWACTAVWRWPRRLAAAPDGAPEPDRRDGSRRAACRAWQFGIGRPLRELASVDPDVSRWLSPAAIDRALAPENFLGSAPLFVERVLKQWEQ